MGQTILNGVDLSIILVFYLLSGLIAIEGIFYWIRHLLFLALLIYSISRRYFDNISELTNNSRRSYYFLYYSNLLLLVQNILLITIHGYTILDFSLVGQTFRLDRLNQASTLYSTVFIVDLLGYSLLLIYFYFLEPVATKKIYRDTGLIATALWLIISITWRTFSSLYSVKDYLRWFLEDFSGFFIFLFLLSILLQVVLWYAIFKLYQVDTSSESKYLDNKRLVGSGITSFVFYTVLLQLLSFLGFFYIIFFGVNYPFGRLIIYILLTKAVLVPIAYFSLHLKIFREYNLLF